jgi:hypothetical protein
MLLVLVATFRACACVRVCVRVRVHRLNAHACGACMQLSVCVVRASMDLIQGFYVLQSCCVVQSFDAAQPMKAACMRNQIQIMS